MDDLDNLKVTSTGRLEKKTRGATVSIPFPGEMIGWIDRFVNYLYYCEKKKLNRAQVIRLVMLNRLREFKEEYEYYRRNEDEEDLDDRWEACFRASGDSYTPNGPDGAIWEKEERWEKEEAAALAKKKAGLQKKKTVRLVK